MTTVIEIAKRRGGLERWGIGYTQFPDFPPYVIPNRFVEALVPDALRALNSLMRATQVERLPHVPAWLPKRPPTSRRDLPTNPWMRRRMRLLAGL